MDESDHEGTTQAVLAPVASQAPREVRDRRTWLVLIPLALIVIYAFIPALDNGFVGGYDDDPNFCDNPYYRGLGAAQVKWAWTTLLLGVYQPLAWLLFEVEYVCCQLDPRGYHLTSLLLHVANTTVLYFLTAALLVRCRAESCFESPWARCYSAGLATALFAVHPLRVEAVAWASCQPYLPCALFSMLSVLAYLRAFSMGPCPRWGWLMGSFILFVAALLFKALAVSLPAVLLILDVYPLRRFSDESGRWFGAPARRALLEKVPFVMTSFLFMGVATAGRAQSGFQMEHYHPSIAIAKVCYAIWFYIATTMLPLNLTAFYQLPRELSSLAPLLGWSIVATLAISAGSFLLRRRWPGLLAAWLSYLVILAPNSGILHISGQVAADRYSYMSTLGLFILAAAGFCRLWRMSSKWPPGAIGITAIGLGTVVGLTALTRNQCRTWRDSETLWTHALAHGGSSNYAVHCNLGTVLYNQGNLDAAEAHYAGALRLRPTFAEAHNNLGSALYGQGKLEAAKARFTEALRLNPGYVDAHNRLATILTRENKLAEAEAHFAEAVRLNPNFAEGHNNLGAVLYTQGKYEPAVAHFTEALRLDPSYAQAHNNLGLILYRRGKYTEAEAHFARAIRLHPGFASARVNLGNVGARLGNFEAATAHYADAIRVDPGFVEAYNALAMIKAACPEAKFRDSAEAVAFATRACELTKGRNPSCLNTLAAAQAEAGDFDAAVKSQQAAIELLADERQKADYRSRLVLYLAKKPYRRP